MDDSKSGVTLEPPAPEPQSLTRSEAAKNRSRDVCTACHEAHVRVRLCPSPFRLFCEVLTFKLHGSSTSARARWSPRNANDAMQADVCVF